MPVDDIGFCNNSKQVIFYRRIHVLLGFVTQVGLFVFPTSGLK